MVSPKHAWCKRFDKPAIKCKKTCEDAQVYFDLRKMETVLYCANFEELSHDRFITRVNQKHCFSDDIFCAFATKKTSQERGKNTCD